ncbi:MAG: ATP-dependent Clp protease ATP-binding subunit ClpA [Rickettsiaceae bacterium]
MLSNELELTLRRALSIATEYKHEYATYEHLLLALIEDKDAAKVLVSGGVAVELLQARLQNYLKHELADLIDEQAKEAKPTAGFQRIIQRAALHSQASGQRVISGVHVLAEFFFEHEAYALLCLKEANLSRQYVLDQLKTKGKHPGESSSKALTSKQTALVTEVLREKDTDKVFELQESEQDNLEKYCVNLNKRANTDAIDCLIGRKQEIQRTIEILCRRKKNNAILIGEPGVGKTAIAEGLAIRIVNKDVPHALKHAVIYSLDIGSLVAGTKFRGDFEERIKSLLEGLRKNKNAILFIDEIHTIIGAGATTTGGMDASNLLKPALAKGELRCIGSTTFKEYHNHFEKDSALVRRFQKIVINEPDEATTLEILNGLKGYYEKHHNVVYDAAALRAAVTLSQRFINDRHLPDKAIDLIDEAGARSKIDSKSKNKVIITQKDIEELISSIMNIPTIRVETDDIAQLKKLSTNLKNLIFGQDEAIESLCASIKLSRAGLRKGTRPTGCYMFAGPTGVGKTELAKQLAILNNMKLLKFDMSEFSESSSVAKLIGSSPGYVGFDQGGMLTGEVDKFPYSIVLLDEIEKANPEVFNLLLQVMDEGKLTDSTGKHINFSNTMIILTTNVVAKQDKVSIGFNQNDYNTVKAGMDMEALDSYFSPEFRSRLDKIILFNPIEGIIEKIVAKNLKELASQLADKKIKLTVNLAVRKYLAEKCFKNKNGARELDRAIDSDIKQAMADEILFGKLKNGGIAIIDYSKKTQGLTFKFFSLKGTDKKQLETS